MSPHAVPSATTQESHRLDLLEGFGVTANGFLPSKSPLDILPGSYYEPWETLMRDLPQLIHSSQLRSRVDKLPVLDTSRLVSESQWRRAYVILSFLCHGYIWTGDRPSEILPPAISVPYLRVSTHLEVPPVATYAALNLWNFTSLNGDFTDLDSIRSLHTFTGTEDESWFYCVSIAMEAKGARILPVMLRALDAVKTRDYDAITNALEELSRCIQETGTLLGRMSERCNPNIFFHSIRPFFAGSKNMGKAGLPRGVFYDEGNGKGSWRQLRGGSNGQSSLIQFFDVMLGVEHTSAGNSRPEPSNESPRKTAPEKSFHEEVRDYMPGPHRRFLEHAARMGSIRNLAMLPASTPEQHRLQQAYQHATTELTDFRNKHLQIVTKYIIIPSRQQPIAKALNLATSNSTSEDNASGHESNELTGTGGTALLPFLKQVRDETYVAGHVRKNTA